MKKLIMAMLTVFCLSFVNFQSALAGEGDVAAATDEAVEMVSVEVAVDVLSIDVDNYTGEVTKRIISHPSVTVTHNPSQIYISSLAYVADRFEEADIYAGKSFEVSGVSLDAGVGYYAVKDDEDFAALYLDAKFPEIFGVTPFAYVESDYGLDGGRGGLFWKFGVEKSLEFFGRDFLSKAELGGNDGLYGYEPRFISFGRLTVSTDIEWSGMTFTPSLSLQKGTSEEGIAGDETLVYGCLSISF